MRGFHLDQAHVFFDSAHGGLTPAIILGIRNHGTIWVDPAKQQMDMVAMMDDGVGGYAHCLSPAVTDLPPLCILQQAIVGGCTQRDMPHIAFQPGAQAMETFYFVRQLSRVTAGQGAADQIVAGPDLAIPVFFGEQIAGKTEGIVAFFDVFNHVRPPLGQGNSHPGPVQGVPVAGR